ncbi:Transient receptor putative cation channel subfamily A member 1 [Mactra antiquata]
MAGQIDRESNCCLCRALSRANLVVAEKLLTSTDNFTDIDNTAVLHLVNYYRQYIKTFAYRNGLVLPEVWQNEGISDTRNKVFDILKLMFKHGFSLNVCHNEEIPLLAAVSTHDELLIKSLLENGANPNMLTPVNKLNAIALAIMLNDASILKLLLSFGAKVNESCCQLLTPLQLSMNKSEHIFKLLFQNGADIQQVYQTRGSNEVCISSPPLIYAIETKNLFLTSILLEHGEDVNQCYGESGNSPIHFAVESFNNDIIKLLIQNGANLNKRNGRGHTPLGIALLCIVNEIDVLKTLVDAGCSMTKGSLINVFRKHYPPLHIAAFYGSSYHFEFIQIVVEKFKSVEFESHSFYEQNMERKTKQGLSNSERTVDLQKQGQQNFVNRQALDGSTAIFMAVLGGSLEIAEYLVNNGADVHYTCGFGSLLHAAVLARNNPINMLEFALQFNCDIDLLNEDGNTCLILSARNSTTAVCNLIVENGAPLNTQDGRFGETALSSSIYFGFESNAEILLRHGADPDIPDFRGTHALYWAIFTCREKGIEMLLDSGVKFTKADLATYPKNIKVMKNPRLKAMLQDYVSEPRSLQQCCRLAIRRHLISLSGGKTILPVMMSLPLPSRLKRYVAMTPLAS